MKAVFEVTSREIDKHGNESGTAALYTSLPAACAPLQELVTNSSENQKIDSIQIWGLTKEEIIELINCVQSMSASRIECSDADYDYTLSVTERAVNGLPTS